VGELVLELERDLAAPRPRVFEAFTAGGRLAQWWGPAGFTVPALEFDPREGARYRIEMQPPEGGPFALTGAFRAVEPPARLAFTFAWEEPDPDDLETLADLTFAERGEGTVVALVQRPFATPARLELHRAGWTESLERLARFLAGGDR
jgi:uncharacterized protein YndB with AHSA1/START domain